MDNPWDCILLLKANEAKRAKEDAAVDKAIENAQMDIPEAMLMTQCRQMLDDFSRRMQSQGLSMDQYFQFTGMTADKMMEDMKPQALKRIQTRLVLEKVAEVENIQPTEEEVNEEISKMAEAYKMEADKLKELLGERELEQMKKGTHAGSHSKTNGRNIAFNILHGIIDRHAGCYGTARAVDIQLNIFTRIFCFQEKKL